MGKRRAEKPGMNYCLPGYLTVEACIAFVTTLSVIVCLVSVGLYKYQYCVSELDTYYELERSICLGESTKEYVKHHAGKWAVDRQVSSSIQLGIFGEKNKLTWIEIQIRTPDPVLALRINKRLQRIKEDGSREIESTISENSGHGGM